MDTVLVGHGVDVRDIEVVCFAALTVTATTSILVRLRKGRVLLVLVVCDIGC
jgi:hypothetical protein